MFIQRYFNDYGEMTSAYVNGKQCSYSYRPDGLRINKTVDGVRTRHVLDGQNVSMDLNDDWSTKFSFIRGVRLVGYIDGVNSSNYFYNFNAHGDVVGLTDSTGAVSKTYDYDAFGNEIAPAAGDGNPFRYCGEFWDNDAGTYYLRARNYDPTIGRFLTEDIHWNVNNMIYGDREYGEGEKKVADILAINQALNLYAYCISNPVGYVDYTGEDTLDIAQIAMSDGVLPIGDLIALGVLVYRGGKWVVNNWDEIVNGAKWTWKQLTGLFKKEVKKLIGVQEKILSTILLTEQIKDMKKVGENSELILIDQIFMILFFHC